MNTKNNLKKRRNLANLKVRLRSKKQNPHHHSHRCHRQAAAFINPRNPKVEVRVKVI